MAQVSPVVKSNHVMRIIPALWLKSPYYIPTLFCLIGSIMLQRNHNNMVKPHSSPGYKPPAQATVVIQPSQIQQVSLTL